MARTVYIQVHGSPDWKDDVRELADLRNQSMSKLLRDMAAVGANVLMRHGTFETFEIDTDLQALLDDLGLEDEDAADE